MTQHHNSPYTRRGFIQGMSWGAAAMAFGMGARATPAHGAGQSPPDWAVSGRYPAYVDEKTGVTVYNLTRSEHDDQVVYQTHPMWTPDMRYFMFYSRRSGAGMRPHLLELDSGKVRPLEMAGYQRGTMTWNSTAFFYIAQDEVYVLDVVKHFQEEDRPRLLGRIPEGRRRYSGDVTVDADGSVLYFGAQLSEEEEKYAVLAFDLTTGETRTVVEVDFKVGHFQANPVRAGELMFCWETGGDAPQRTWFVKGDGSGLKPLYKETYDEWVTHEVWWGPDHIIFTIWPYDENMRAKPHGIAEASTATGPDGAMAILAQYPAWHTHGSPDRKWALGDDFDRNIWLVNVAARERKLLTQGHNAGEYKTHPHGTFTPDSRGLVFTSSRDKVENVLYVPLPEWERLA